MLNVAAQYKTNLTLGIHKSVGELLSDSVDLGCSLQYC